MEALQSIGTDRKMRGTIQYLYRFISDMRKVNEATKLNIFPIPNIPNLINKCHDKDRYTCLDIEDAFFVVKCAEESRPLAHINYTTQRVLGYIVSKEGRRVDPSLVDAINKLAPPKTLQAIQSLLGLAQVAREYIPAMATVIAPLQALSMKGIDVEAEWRDDYHVVALRNLKAILTNAPVLLIPDMSKKFRIHVDCCRVGRGCGAILLQENNQGAWQPVAYWSRQRTNSGREEAISDSTGSDSHA